MTVKELIDLLKLEPENATVKMEGRSTPTFPRGSFVTRIDVEFYGRETFIIITDFGGIRDNMKTVTLNPEMYYDLIQEGRRYLLRHDSAFYGPMKGVLCGCDQCKLIRPLVNALKDLIDKSS